MKIVNAKKIMGVAAAALLVGSFVSCAQDNAQNYGIDNIDTTTKVANFAEATADGLDFSAVQTGYKITIVSSKAAVDAKAVDVGVSFTKSANLKAYPFVDAGKVYTVKVEDDGKEVIKFEILSKGGAGEVAITTPKPTIAFTAPVKGASDKTRAAGKYSVTLGHPTANNAKVLDFKTEYSIIREDGLDVLKAAALSGSVAASTATAPSYTKPSYVVDATATAPTTSKTVNYSGIIVNAGANTIADPTYYLLNGYKATVKAQTKFRVSAVADEWYTVDAEVASDELAANESKVKVNVQYTVNDNVPSKASDTALNYAGAAARGNAYYSAIGVYDSAKNMYSWSSDVYAQAKKGDAIATTYTAKVVATVEGLAGTEQKTFEYNAASSGTNTKTYKNFYTTKAVEAGSAWSCPDLTTVVAKDKIYKGYVGSWYNSRKVVTAGTSDAVVVGGTYYTYNYVEADRDDVYQHGIASNWAKTETKNGVTTVVNSGNTKTTVIPTVVYGTYDDQYNCKVVDGSVIDNTVTITLKGSKTYTNE